MRHQEPIARLHWFNVALKGRPALLEVKPYTIHFTILADTEIDAVFAARNAAYSEALVTLKRDVRVTRLD